MDKRKFGHYVFGGLWSANGDSMLGVAIGALAGVTLGWFIAAAVLEKTNSLGQLVV